MICHGVWLQGEVGPLTFINVSFVLPLKPYPGAHQKRCGDKCEGTAEEENVEGEPSSTSEKSSIEVYIDVEVVVIIFNGYNRIFDV